MLTCAILAVGLSFLRLEMRLIRLSPGVPLDVCRVLEGLEWLVRNGHWLVSWVLKAPAFRAVESQQIGVRESRRGFLQLHEVDDQYDCSGVHQHGSG